MRAADLTRDDIGAAVEFQFGDITVYGRVAGIRYVVGMVNLILETDDIEVPVVVDRDKNITITYEHARFRALTETDPELRGTLLHEVNHLAVLSQVHNILGGSGD